MAATASRPGSGCSPTRAPGWADRHRPAAARPSGDHWLPRHCRCAADCLRSQAAPASLLEIAAAVGAQVDAVPEAVDDVAGRDGLVVRALDAVAVAASTAA